MAKEDVALIADGLTALSGLDELKEQIRKSIKYYEAKVEYYSQRLGTLLRQNNTEAKKVGQRPSKGWIRVGSLLLNINDPTQAHKEMLFKALEEFKAKLVGATSFLRSLEDTQLEIPKESSFTLYVRNGIPERLIVDQPKPEKNFTYAARFRVTKD